MGLNVVVGTVAASVAVGVLLPRTRRSQGVRRSGRRWGGGWGGPRVRLGGAVAKAAGSALAVVRPPDRLVATSDMVAFLDAMARSLRSGAGLHAALRSAGGSGGVHAEGLGGLVGSLDAGVPLWVALERWRGDAPSSEVSLAAVALGFGLATGGSVARAVDGAAATLRERLALAGEARVLATQARASAVVVGGAPVAFTVLVVIADPRVGGVLFGTVLGAACLVVGGLLEVACVVWMRRLVSRVAHQ